MRKGKSGVPSAGFISCMYEIRVCMAYLTSRSCKALSFGLSEPNVRASVEFDIIAVLSYRSLYRY